MSAAVPPQGKRKTWRAAAGTLPIAAHCQLEFVASTITQAHSTPLVLISRSLLAFGWDQSVRVQDMARSVVIPDQYQPSTLMHGFTSTSKDGNPMHLHAPATGLLGPYVWFPQHLAEVTAFGRTFPAWEKVWGTAGNVSKATTFTPFAQSTRKDIRQALKDILALPPLSLSESEIKDLDIKGHSCHGTPSDWSRVIGPNPLPVFPSIPNELLPGFSECEARALGHWLRDANAPEGNPSLTNHRKPTKAAAGAGRSAQSQPAAAPGAPSLHGEMVLRYTSGEGREGERATQLRLRGRLMDWAARALAHWCSTHATTWLSLPRGRADIAILNTRPESVMPQQPRP